LHVVLALIVPAAVASVVAACGSFSDANTSPLSEGGVSAEGATPADGAVLTDGESSPDAGRLACATRTDRPLLCAEFDDSPPLFYVGGIGSAVPTQPRRTVVAPGASPPSAMWSDGRAGVVQELTASDTDSATHVRVDLDVNVDEYVGNDADGALVEVGIAPHQCFVGLVINANRIVLQTHCVYTDDATDWYGDKQLLDSQLASKRWWHLTLDVDYAQATAVATLDGKRTVTLGLNPSATPGGTPYVKVGGIVGARIGFDNALATVSK
jgi:hypothetical protein